MCFKFIWHIPRDGLLIIMIKMIISQIMDIDEDNKRVENRRDTF